jgi:cutinase
MAWALSALVATRHATAGPCPDVEVVSARGTDEPPGPGSIGQTFIDSADHIAAVALFGNPKSALARTYGRGQLPALSPLYRPKTIDLCVPNDPICSEGTNEAAHHLYDQNGMTTQAATFVAQKL